MTALLEHPNILLEEIGQKIEDGARPAYVLRTGFLLIQGRAAYHRDDMPHNRLSSYFFFLKEIFQSLASSS